ncbi:MAG: hypothetical protein JF616_11840 [Fibrobacteres bacterium]|jgi:hypothetical protein|nr:hypothetical protein [Fibrobacterota bacterium]
MMNKFAKALIVVAGLALGAKAQLAGLGWDNNWQEIQARLGLGRNFIDVGAGMALDPGNDNHDARFTMSASGLFLGHLHDWGPVDTYFAAGARFQKTAAATDNLGFSGVVGFQPEVTLLDHIVVSTRFGFEIPFIPNFIIRTGGNAISIVDGLNFKILF